ncbi:MAG: serine/threonine-protein kinase PknK [Leptospiraceae bacterium]|nr:serine/threonine-protein kinase PknK [Leptospiraceae bacterium]
MIISGYETKEKIYESNKTIIYRAIRNRDGKILALKILNEENLSKETIARFKYEYEIQKSVFTEGILEAFDFEKYSNQYAIAMEYFNGSSLQQYDFKNLDIESILKIFISVAEILNRIHEMNIIHKDINPSNILYNSQTKEVKIIDFGISTKLTIEKNQAILNPNLLEGTLSYISPEQTRRMNRPIDYRTDYYSLGVSLYETLTKQKPFPNTGDALEIIHCHIAKEPIQPHEIDSSIPVTLSNITLKLMSKNAEDRYQTLLGLIYDLQKCLEQFLTLHKIEAFEIGANDKLSKFRIPQKLYGREKEIQILLDSFKRISEGNTEIMLVSGFSGIGKSVLINEIQKPIVEKRGYFITGKYDQFQRNIPYSAIIDAFRGLIRQILAESSVYLNLWKEKLLEALGKNGQVIVDVIPELESILGKQEEVPKLSPNESQNRFNFVFQNFVRVFASEEHPIVIFIDDLQWIDSASLQLIHLLITNPENRFLFFIGAYRDNEVDDTHPLKLALEKLKKDSVSIREIQLNNLDFRNVNQLVADSLNSDTNLTEELSELVYSKTAGNPFFVNELLKLLFHKKLLYFAHSLQKWNWDIQKINAIGISDSVVSLMTSKMEELPKDTLAILKLASCIGTVFDLKTLSIVSESSKLQISTSLWEALQQGFIYPLDDSYKFIQDMEEVNPGYKFAHDRIQQSAYLLIPEEEKTTIHLKIGRLMLEHLSTNEQKRKENHSQYQLV